MSYILDALRRADAERERGAVPGLYTQPALSDGGPPERALWPWAATAVVVVVGGVAAVNLLMAGPDAPVVVSGVAQTPPMPAVMAAPQVVAPAAPVQTTTVQAPVVQLPTVQAPVVQPRPQPQPQPPVQAQPTQQARPPGQPAAPQLAEPAAAPPAPRLTAPSADVRSQPPAPPIPKPADVVRSAPSAEPKAVTIPAPTAAVPAQPKAPEADPAARVLALSELSDDVRRSLPALAINGASYSETPAHRMLIANGQVYREGDEPAPGLVVEQIRARSAVLRWRGVRYSVPY